MSDNRYVILNCPTLMGNRLCYGKTIIQCADCTDCLLKRIYEDVKTVYKTPEYFEELAKRGDKEQELIESAWHNVAHMVISKLDIQECE